MDIQELKQRLDFLGAQKDKEERHELADKALLEYINDPDVTRLFEEMDKWYA